MPAPINLAALNYQEKTLFVFGKFFQCKFCGIGKKIAAAFAHFRHSVLGQKNKFLFFTWGFWEFVGNNFISVGFHFGQQIFSVLSFVEKFQAATRKKVHATFWRKSGNFLIKPSAFYMRIKTSGRGVLYGRG